MYLFTWATKENVLFNNKYYRYLRFCLSGDIHCALYLTSFEIKALGKSPIFKEGWSIHCAFSFNLV